MKISVCVPGFIDAELIEEVEDLSSWDVRYEFTERLKREFKTRKLYDTIEFHHFFNEINLNGTYNGERFELMLNKGLTSRYDHEMNLIADLDDELWKLLPDAINAAVKSTNARIKDKYNEVENDILELKWEDERPSVEDDYWIEF